MRRSDEEERSLLQNTSQVNADEIFIFPDQSAVGIMGRKVKPDAAIAKRHRRKKREKKAYFSMFLDPIP